MLIFNVVKMAIGLDFVKNIDRNWKKRLISIDRMKDDIYFDKSNLRHIEDIAESNSTNIENNEDFWEFWKKRYYITR